MKKEEITDNRKKINTKNPMIKIFNNNLANQKIQSFLKQTNNSNFFIKLANENILRKYSEKLKQGSNRTDHFKFNKNDPDEKELNKAIFIRQFDFNRNIKSAVILKNKKSSEKKENYVKNNKSFFTTGIPFSMKNEKALKLRFIKRSVDEDNCVKIKSYFPKINLLSTKKTRNFNSDYNNENTITLESKAYTTRNNELITHEDISNAVDSKNDIIHNQDNKKLKESKPKKISHLSDNNRIISNINSLNNSLQNPLTARVTYTKKDKDSSSLKLEIKNNKKDPQKITLKKIKNLSEIKNKSITNNKDNFLNIHSVENCQNESELKQNKINKHIIKKLNLEGVYIHPESRIYSLINSFIPIENLENDAIRAHKKSSSSLFRGKEGNSLDINLKFKNLKKEISKNSIKMKTMIHDLQRTQNENDQYIKNYGLILKMNLKKKQKIDDLEGFLGLGI